MLMFGTSANLTGQGQRFRIEDVEPSVIASVDMVVDYGLQKWHVVTVTVGGGFQSQNSASFFSNLVVLIAYIYSQLSGFLEVVQLPQLLQLYLLLSSFLCLD